MEDVFLFLLFQSDSQIEAIIASSTDNQENVDKIVIDYNPN